MEVNDMVASISADRHAERVCVVSLVAGPPHVISLRDGSVRRIPAAAAGQRVQLISVCA